VEYTGTYSDTFGKQPGEIQLKWSRIERRFNGTWREGQDRFGELSIRLVNNELRGALTKMQIRDQSRHATPGGSGVDQEDGDLRLRHRAFGRREYAPSYLWFDIDKGKSFSAGARFPTDDTEVDDDEYQQWRIAMGIDFAASFARATRRVALAGYRVRLSAGQGRPMGEK